MIEKEKHNETKTLLPVEVIITLFNISIGNYEKWFSIYSFMLIENAFQESQIVLIKKNCFPLKNATNQYGINNKI
jgi:hypothetical protein